MGSKTPSSISVYEPIKTSSNCQWQWIWSFQILASLLGQSANIIKICVSWMILRKRVCNMVAPLLGMSVLNFSFLCIFLTTPLTIINHSSDVVNQSSNVINHPSNVRLWHHKLGHLNYKDLSSLFENEMTMGILMNLPIIDDVCRGYQLEKQTKKHFPNSQNPSNKIDWVGTY
jgi:hypothetical protein